MGTEMEGAVKGERIKSVSAGGKAVAVTVAPEQQWHQSSSGTRAAVAPEQKWHQSSSGTRAAVAPG